jgi:hypothetical protein
MTTTLALIIAVVWLAIMLLVVVACRMAAKGDRELRAARSIRGWERLPAPTEPRVGMPPFKAYRLRDPRGGLQSTAAQHVRDRPQ